MSEPIKPALTAREWWGVLAMGVDWTGFKMTRHQIAAVALVEQPFGFTHQHLRDIDWVLDQAGGTGDYLRDVREVLTPIRELIAALLPPDKPSP